MRIGLVGRQRVLAAARQHVVDEHVGVLFVGEPGVGKTRLLAETLDVVTAAGWHTERFVASEATRRVQFGPLIALLPGDGTDRTHQIAGVRRSLTARARGRPIAIAVDDAHLVDDATLACLVDLAHHSEVVVLGTARSTEPAPSDLTNLWASEALARVDVEPLGTRHTAEFAARQLGGGVTPELAKQVWERTRGVPLFIRELLLDALADRRLAASDGIWGVDGQLRSGARLQELVQTRLAALDEASQHLVELLAVTEPLRLDLLGAGEGAQLDALEQRGMVRIDQLGGQWVARFDHPVIAEAVVAGLPTRRQIEHRRTAAERTLAAGRPAPGDALAVARWRDECGDPIEPDVAIAAGREALRALDLDRAVELGRRVAAARPLAGNLLLGEALRLQAQAAEAEHALAQAADLADDDETIVRVAIWRSTLHAHQLGDPDGALTLLDVAAARVASPIRALELHSEAAFLAGLLGRFDDAVEANRAILRTRDFDGPTRWTALMNLLFGQVMLADLCRIDEPIDEMATMADGIEATRPEGIDLYWALRIATATLRGDLIECEQRYVAHVQRCVTRDQIHGAAASVLIYPLLLRGSPQAAPIAHASLASLAASDTFLATPIAQGGLTLVQAAAGELAAAESTCSTIDETHARDLLLAPFVGRSKAAVAALHGRPDEAAEIAAATGSRCVAATYVFFGSLALYDAVRYGRADLVADQLGAATEDLGSPLLRAMAAHAEAQRAGDGWALDRVAESFAQMHANVLVIEAFADAARAHHDEADRNRSATLAALWQRHTPAPNALSRAAPAALTERELDVVQRALTGESSKAIAEAEFLSVRTVDNHLGQAYRKLGVGSRDELRNALQPNPTVRTLGERRDERTAGTRFLPR